MRILRLLPAAGLALSIAGCARCPYPQTQPAITTEWVTATVEAPGPRARPADSVRVVVVEMRTTHGGASGEFAPRVVRARRGDLLRFSMADGDAHHNVSFASFNHDKPGVRLPPESPYLTNEGESWQVRADLAPGTYEFACVPHAEAHGGTLIVEP
ncbi:MAG TPA: plastocyanin/azurin family copper-binding protein [Longimicrobium sp.]|nr:plastocyanin/azurin family copper-binding protein [Longimicrobium sp.]